MRYLLAFQAILAPSVFATSSVVFESLHQVPRGWTWTQSAQPEEPVKLRLSLKQQNLDEFYENLMQVSTPDHPRYGQHYEGHELRSLLKPSDEATSTAVRWLQENNVTSIRDDGDYIFLRTTVATANKLLDTQFAWYQNEAGEHLLRTMRYSVPQEVAAHINFLQPTTRFGSTQPLATRLNIMNSGETATGQSKWISAPPELKENAALAVNSSCNSTITPRCLYQLYNINLKGSSAGNNQIGYASFVGQSARQTDNSLFAQTYAPFAAGKNFSVVTFNGGINDQTSNNDSGEANLDQQYAMAVGFDVPAVEFITGGLGQLVPDGDTPNPADNSNEPFLEFAMGLLAMDNAAIPNSISISYGENEQEIPLAYATQVCNMFAQLGARGKSIIVASGDSGTGDFCQANDGTNATRFQPQFPGACPYVTAVGGTRGIAPETAVAFSSGGFSNVWPRPAYQDAAVPAYAQQMANNFTGLFNASGRGFPDVATQSVGYRIIQSGRDVGVQGTSAAAPTFNGVIALLNSARIASNQSTMGFLNPWLYSNASAAFNDVTTGTSAGCNGQSRFNGGPNGSPVVPNAGFPAAVGWDAVTGLGTPDFAKLLALAAPNVQNQGGVISGA
ncbi:hypothetical protein N0V93_005119 [Gnomoniopsis smithogilvyi]|uniref:tripeptidyl-peptidase II n=1 Tax=Gnomoniopsis smithogilvyi TaxID=1191159 RepID=A0A9W8YTW6_9PEZI|nr:hypothetical protein N0V93_005119 [Gnomoniopsis smithogilvyi]